MSAAAKHSTGPWWVMETGVRNRGGYICHTNSVQRYEGQDERYAREVAEREADKALIADAPELLAALRDVIGWVPGRAHWHTDAAQKSVVRASALIAKHTGSAAHG